MIFISKLNLKLKSIDQSNNQVISQLTRQPFDLSNKAVCVTNAIRRSFYGGKCLNNILESTIVMNNSDLKYDLFCCKKVY